MTTIYWVADWVFNDVDFGIDVKEARERAEITQGELAAALGLSTPNTIGRIERGVMVKEYENGLKMRYFIALCNLFDLKPPKYFIVQEAQGADMVSDLLDAPADADFDEEAYGNKDISDDMGISQGWEL